MRQKKAQLASLGQWTHIDCLKWNARASIHDTLLHELLPAKSLRVPVIDKGKSRLTALLGATDLDALEEAAGPPLAIGDVPGGTICFLFERGKELQAKGDEEGSDVES